MTETPAVLDPYRQPCPVPHCPNPVPPGHMMCAYDWRLASPAAQTIVNDAYLAWCRGKGSEEAYLEAAAYAVRSAQHSQRHLAQRHPQVAARRMRSKGSRSGRRG